MVVVDTREKLPYVFKRGLGVRGSVVRKLDYGDYQIDGYPELICIERKKSIDELCGNFGKHRARFERELQRMQDCKHRFIVVEDDYWNIEGSKFSKLSPASIYATIAAFSIRYGVSFVFAGDRNRAFKMVRHLLLKAYSEEVACG